MRAFDTRVDTRPITTHVRARTRHGSIQHDAVVATWLSGMPVDAHEQTLSPQEDANPSIAISRILCRKPPHRGQRRRILDRLAQSVTHDRTRNAQQPTSSSLRQTMFPDEADLFAPGLWAYHFFRFTSRMII